MIPWTLLGAGVALLFLVPLLGILFFAASLAFPNPLNWWFYSRKRPVQGLAVNIPGANNEHIPGRWYACQDLKINNPPAVLLCHGRSRGKGFVEPLALALSQSFSVLSFDFRNHGERGYGPCTMGLSEADDVKAGLDYLRGLKLNKLAVVGISMGSAAASCHLGLNSTEDIRALALIGPYASVEDLVSANRRQLHLPAFIEVPVLKLASVLCGQNLGQINLVTYLAHTQIPLGLFWGTRDQLTGYPHAKKLRDSLSIDRAESYEGNHDEPWNSELQEKLLAWLIDTINKS